MATSKLSGHGAAARSKRAPPMLEVCRVGRHSGSKRREPRRRAGGDRSPVWKQWRRKIHAQQRLVANHPAHLRHRAVRWRGHPAREPGARGRAWSHPGARRAAHLSHPHGYARTSSSAAFDAGDRSAPATSSAPGRFLRASPGAGSSLRVHSRVANSRRSPSAAGLCRTRSCSFSTSHLGSVTPPGGDDVRTDPAHQ